MISIRNAALRCVESSRLRVSNRACRSVVFALTNNSPLNRQRLQEMVMPELAGWRFPEPSCADSSLWHFSVWRHNSSQGAHWMPQAEMPTEGVQSSLHTLHNFVHIIVTNKIVLEGPSGQKFSCRVSLRMKVASKDPSRQLISRTRLYQKRSAPVEASSS